MNLIISHFYNFDNNECPWTKRIRQEINRLNFQGREEKYTNC